MLRWSGYEERLRASHGATGCITLDSMEWSREDGCRVEALVSLFAPF